MSITMSNDQFKIKFEMCLWCQSTAFCFSKSYHKAMYTEGDRQVALKNKRQIAF